MAEWTPSTSSSDSWEGAGGLASDLDKVESVPSVLSFAGQSGPGRLNSGS